MTSARPHIDTHRIRSFGRVKSRRLNTLQERLVTDLLPQLAITLKEDQPFSPAQYFDSPPQKMILEIGFGGGEHVAGMAKIRPQDGFIGCEPFTNGVAGLLRQIEEDALQQNTRIFHGDARLLLETCETGCIDEAYILFPDPWPKVKHHKKRIINDVMFSLLHKVMKQGGALTIATDHVDYAQWIANYVESRTDFRQTQADRTTPPADWIPTRYQHKAAVEGREPVFFILESV
jgi:tRNA (guanine-N7-)-methyltransferase